MSLVEIQICNWGYVRSAAIVYSFQRTCSVSVQYIVDIHIAVSESILVSGFRNGFRFSSSVRQQDTKTRTGRKQWPINRGNCAKAKTHSNGSIFYIKLLLTLRTNRTFYHATMDSSADRFQKRHYNACKRLCSVLWFSASEANLF